MRRFATPFSYLFVCGILGLIISLTGCESKSDAPVPPTLPSAQSGAKPNAAPTVPPQVQIGPPK